MKSASPYQKVATSCLTVLWIGALLFCSSILYYWHQYDMLKFKSSNIFASPQNFFVDRLLLSSKELELDEMARLINTNSNTDTDNAKSYHLSAKTAPERKEIYSRILEQKMKIINTQKADSFTIKSLSQ